MEWLLPVSLVCITGGIILSVYEEWDRAGLTDTSLTSLACWVLGLCGVAGWGVLERDSWVFLVAVAPTGLFVYWMILKGRDRSRTRRGRR